MGPDLSHSGEHGDLPLDFQAWRRGLTYTVRPELLRPLPPKREVRLNVTVRTSHTYEALTVSDVK